MATNRNRRTRSINKFTIHPAELYYLQHGTLDGAPPHNEFLDFTDDAEWLHLWERSRDEIMAGWLKEYPATRPYGWWKFDAPKEPIEGWDYEHFNSAQRQRVGGTGTPSHEVLNVWGGFSFGIPNSWVEPWAESYYNGRSKDIHGNPIGTKYKEGHFKGRAIDPNDPPRFESQAAYLNRHGLLTPAELAFLEKHPDLLEPEKIEF